jgi:hypothetical protein
VLAGELERLDGVEREQLVDQDDRSWLLHTEVDLDSTFVAGSRRFQNPAEASVAARMSRA